MFRSMTEKPRISVVTKTSQLLLSLGQYPLVRVNIIRGGRKGGEARKVKIIDGIFHHITCKVLTSDPAFSNFSQLFKI